MNLIKILKWWFVDQFMFYTGGGGSGGGPSSSTTYSSNVPEYARPYVENMLQSAQTQIYNDDMTSFRPYQPYSSDVNNYFAEFSPMQKAAQESAYNLQTPGQYGVASGMAGAAGMGGLNAAGQSDYLGKQALGYGEAGSMYGGAGATQAMNSAREAQNMASRFGSQGAMYGEQAAGLAPKAQMYGQNAADIGMGGLGYGAQGAGYGQEAAGRAQQGYNAGSQFAQQATDPNAIKGYMSPYMQNVVDYQKQSAVRDYQKGQGMRQAGAVAKGAFGGSRQAIENAEAQRNLNAQLQGIEATGAQEAFKNAQAQQQFGANLGLQGLQAGYQGSGMGIQGAQAGLSGLNTAMQGQQAGLAGLGQAGSLYGQGMQGAQTGLSGVGQYLSGAQTGLAGTAQGMQGAGYGLQGVQGALGAGQYGLQGYGMANQAAGTLGTLGGQQLAAEQGIIGTKSQMGGQQQTLEQSKINQAIQDYATAQQYPMMQLGQMNAMLRGLPLQQATTQSYQAAPSAVSQLSGLGLTGAAMYGLSRKKGGKIKEKSGSDLADLRLHKLLG